jgi:hypothetical protein
VHTAGLFKREPLFTGSTSQFLVHNNTIIFALRSTVWSQRGCLHCGLPNDMNKLTLGDVATSASAANLLLFVFQGHWRRLNSNRLLARLWPLRCNVSYLERLLSGWAVTELGFCMEFSVEPGKFSYHLPVIFCNLPSGLLLYLGIYFLEVEKCSKVTGINLMSGIRKILDIFMQCEHFILDFQKLPPPPHEVQF